MTHGKRLSVAALLVVLSANGCSVMAGSVRPTASAAEAIRTISVVPVEPPPLDVFMPNLIGGADALSMRSMPSDPIIGGATLLLMLSAGTAFLFDLATGGTQRISDNAAEVEQALTQGGLWVPTVALGNDMARFVNSAGQRQATAAASYARLPIQRRERTWHLQNWYDPITDWFNEERSSLIYPNDAVAGDRHALLEVGLANYSLTKSHFVLHVLAKLVDPASRRVVGRTRAFSIAPTDGRTVITNGGVGFKPLFDTTATPLIQQALRDLRLLDQK